MSTLAAGLPSRVEVEQVAGVPPQTRIQILGGCSSLSDAHLMEDIAEEGRNQHQHKEHHVIGHSYSQTSS